MTTESSISLPALLSADQASSCCASLVARCCEPEVNGQTVVLEVDGPDATAIALQLAIACHRSLQTGGTAVSQGPNLSRIMKPHSEVDHQLDGTGSAANGAFA